MKTLVGPGTSSQRPWPAYQSRDSHVPRLNLQIRTLRSAWLVNDSPRPRPAGPLWTAVNRCGSKARQTEPAKLATRPLGSRIFLAGHDRTVAERRKGLESKNNKRPLKDVLDPLLIIRVGTDTKSYGVLECEFYKKVQNERGSFVRPMGAVRGVLSEFLLSAVPFTARDQTPAVVFLPNLTPPHRLGILGLAVLPTPNQRYSQLISSDSARGKRSEEAGSRRVPPRGRDLMLRGEGGEGFEPRS